MTISQQVSASPAVAKGFDLPVTEIRPSKRYVSVNLKEIWHYRELLYFLAWRDVKVRYKQTGLGIAWAVLQPLLSMIVFSIFFGRLAKMPSDGIPYPVFVYCGLLPWQLFALALTESSNSVISNERLITKIYFPRLIIPAAAILPGLVDFGVAFVLVAIMMWYYRIVPTLAMLAVPLFVLLAVITALAVGVWLAALNVKYRDVRYTLPFMTQFWMFATPVAYPSSLVPERWRPLLGLNPMAGVVEGFRWALLGTAAAPGPMLAVSALIVALLLVSALLYFRRMEKSFADLI
jgi:lipopolysaccharide transport system permease protein